MKKQKKKKRKKVKTSLFNGVKAKLSSIGGKLQPAKKANLAQRPPQMHNFQIINMKMQKKKKRKKVKSSLFNGVKAELSSIGGKLWLRRQTWPTAPLRDIISNKKI